MKKGLIITLFIVLSGTCGCVGCAGSANKNPETASEAVDTKNEIKAEENDDADPDLKEETPKEDDAPVKEETPKEDDAAVEEDKEEEADEVSANMEVQTVLYEDGFEKDYDYGRYADENNTMMDNDYLGEKICVEGTVEKFNESNNSLIVSSGKGDWAVDSYPGGTDEYYEMVKNCVGKKVRIYGGYLGYSGKFSVPVLTYITEGITNYAYRMEDADNSFRLTNNDLGFKMPDFDRKRTIGNLTYMEPSSWKASDYGDGVYYLNEDPYINVMLTQHIELPSNLTDWTDSYEILSDLADRYAKDGKVLRKEKFELLGYPAMRFEMTWKDDDMPVPMSLYSYMLLADTDYYYIGVGEPFLAGESCKKFMEEISKTITLDNGSKTDAETDDVTESKTGENEKDNTEKKTDETKKKSEYPGLSEVYGSYGMIMTLTRNDTGESYSEMSVMNVTSKELLSYDESTGKGHMNLDGGGSGTMEFYYRNDGGIQCAGNFKAVFDGVDVSITLSGTKK